jgi:hypothetical protein
MTRAARQHLCAAALVLGVCIGSATAAPPPLAEPVTVIADWFSCSSGKYALTLPRHYPSLRVIGSHRVLDIESQSQGGVTRATRRFQYIGMRLDVRVSSDAPDRYQMLSAEAISRRWNIGKLSVGSDPWWWPWSREPELAKVTLDGVIKLQGPSDSAVLQLSKGRIDKVMYSCRLPSRV